MSVNSAVSSLNLEESFVSPCCIPWVCHEPVVNSIFSSPTEALNGMSSKKTSSFVLVNSALVVHEVLVNSEGSFYWSELLDLLLSGLNRCWMNSLCWFLWLELFVWVSACRLTSSVLSRFSWSVWVAIIINNSCSSDEVPCILLILNKLQNYCSLLRTILASLFTTFCFILRIISGLNLAI